jgi:hypothetical protein
MMRDLMEVLVGFDRRVDRRFDGGLIEGCDGRCDTGLG